MKSLSRWYGATILCGTVKGEWLSELNSASNFDCFISNTLLQHKSSMRSYTCVLLTLTFRNYGCKYLMPELQFMLPFANSLLIFESFYLFSTFAVSLLRSRKCQNVNTIIALTYSVMWMEKRMREKHLMTAAATAAAVVAAASYIMDIRVWSPQSTFAQMIECDRLHH